MVYNFNAVKVRDDIVSWIQLQVARHKVNKKIAIGISGGKDSSVAAALCCRAVGAENVHGIMMPNDVQSDIADGYTLCKELKIDSTVINIKSMYNAYLLQYLVSTRGSGNIDEYFNVIANGDLAQLGLDRSTIEELVPRVRENTLRLWASDNGAVIVSPINLSKLTIGDYNIYMANCGGINPFGKLTSNEVVEIGKTMSEIPTRILYKENTGGFSKESIKNTLGVTYDDIHRYLRNIEIDEEVWHKINDLELDSNHKRDIMTFEI